MLTDPQDIVVNGVTVSMPRTGVNGNSADYRSADQKYKYSISHQYGGKRTRHLVRLDWHDQSANAFGVVVPYSMSTYLVVDVPADGSIDTANQKYRVDALLAELTATSGALITKVLGGES